MNDNNHFVSLLKNPNYLINFDFNQFGLSIKIDESDINTFILDHNLTKRDTIEYTPGFIRLLELTNSLDISIYEKRIDYLTEDDPINGQLFVCLSFLSKRILNL